MASSYFDRFPGFLVDPSASIKTEFDRLSRLRGWSKRTERRQRENCYANEFDRHFATYASDLEKWQSLCREVHIYRSITTTSQCKKILRKIHVNLVDLIDCRRTGGHVHVFPSLTSLRSYTRETGKIFPKRAAKADGFLKDLLREILR